MSTRPVSVLPNAGLPQSVDGQAVYALTPDELALCLKQFVEEYGVRIVGGCCGTTPEHLRAVVDAIDQCKPAETHATPRSVAANASHSIVLASTGQPVVMAEELNAAHLSEFREMIHAAAITAASLRFRNALSNRAARCWRSAAPLLAKTKKRT